MQLEKRTFYYQAALARYCRTSNFTSIPGCLEERAATYRSLVFSGVFDALSRAYPIARHTLGEESWDALITNFFSRHPCASPSLWRMPHELLLFVDSCIDPHRESSHEELPPWLPDLLLFEWIEIEVHMMPDGDLAQVSPEGDALTGRMVLNPDSKLLALEYPVFRAKGEELVTLKGQYNLICFRDEEGVVRFIELAGIFLSIVQLLQRSPQTVAELFENLDSDTLPPLEEIQNFFSAAFSQGLLVGFLVEG